MAGSAGNMAEAEQAQLKTWAESLRTGGGNQKYVVIVGPGTGAYATKTQFKVLGFQSLGPKAATYHISIN